jgi:hypothetical protein
MLKEDLGNRKLCVRFFPCSLTSEQWEGRVKPCKDIIGKDDADKSFNKCITGNQTRWYAYDPEKMRQSSEWVGETFLRQKKWNSKRFRIKIVLINFPSFKS